MKYPKILLKFIGAAMFTASLMPFTASADEGMWLPIFLKQFNEADMIARGFKLTADEIYSINKSSLKDAVVQFNGGCTAEIISDKALILTNHHCGFDVIAKHSTVEKDYLKNGFWAMKQDEEIISPGVTASILVRMDDVSQQVISKIPAGATEKQREDAVRKAMQDIAAEATKGTHYRAFVRPMFYGTEFYLFVNEIFTDVRLVGAPPSSIGKFGGDTDNWVWPRHTGDFSIFRIYAGSDNKPAEPNKNNVPYKPKHVITVSTAGVKPGDFTMVLGYPGRTQEYLSSYAIDIITEEVNKPKIKLRRKRLDIIEEAMAESDALRLRYADLQSGLANGWKKWMGENMGIARTGGIARKQKEEREFTEWVAKNGSATAQYAEVLPKLKQAYEQYRSLILPVEYQREAMNATEVMGLCASLNKLSELAVNDPKKAAEFKADVEKLATNMFSKWYRKLDEKTFAAAMQAYMNDIRPEMLPGEITSLRQQISEKHKDNYLVWAKEVFDNSNMTDAEKAKKLIDKVSKKGKKALEKEVIFNVWAAVSKNYDNNLLPRYMSLIQEIDLLNRAYLKGRREMQPNRKFYPDANSTFRVAYGEVKPYKPADGVTYTYRTTIEGIMEKEGPAGGEFEVSPKLKQLYENKDFGNYAEGNTLPVAFIASNHTTGGNSGSPVFNAKGELIGTNFDRVWEGTMSDLNYDASICRNIALDVRFTLFVIDKYAGAGHLVKEMKLVK